MRAFLLRNYDSLLNHPGLFLSNDFCTHQDCSHSQTYILTLHHNGSHCFLHLRYCSSYCRVTHQAQHSIHLHGWDANAPDPSSLLECHDDSFTFVMLVHHIGLLRWWTGPCVAFIVWTSSPRFSFYFRSHVCTDHRPFRLGLSNVHMPPTPSGTDRPMGRAGISTRWMGWPSFE